MRTLESVSLSALAAPFGSLLLAQGQLKAEAVPFPKRFANETIDETGRVCRRRLSPSYAHVFESEGAEASGIEKILGIDDDGVLE